VIRKDTTSKTKLLQFQKLDIINKVHIIPNTLCNKTIKISQTCVNTKYGYTKSRYGTPNVSEQMCKRRMKTAKYEKRALTK
jgi:hypothetical protein